MLCGRGHYDDGAAGAPSGTIPYPDVLAGYAFPPPWKVPGVHYFVGIDAAVRSALLSPTTISGTGITVNTETQTVTVQVASLVAPLLIQNIDFSNWSLFLNGTSAGHKVTVRNCLFVVGALHLAPIVQTINSGDLTVEKCEFDGNNDADLDSAMITCSHGNIVIEYVRFTDVSFDGVKFGKCSSFLMRFILMDGQLGIDPAHFDGVKMQSSPNSNIKILYVFAYITASTYFNSVARIASVNVDAIDKPEVAYIVAIGLPAASDGLVNVVQIRGSDSVGGLIYRPYTHDVYCDWPSDPGFFPFALAADTSTLTEPVSVNIVRMTDGTQILPNTNF